MEARDGSGQAGRGTSQVALSGREAQPVLVSRSSSPATFCHRRANDTAPVQRKSGAILATCGFYQEGSGSEARRATNTRVRPTLWLRVRRRAQDEDATRHFSVWTLCVPPYRFVFCVPPNKKHDNDTLVVAVVVQLLRLDFRENPARKLLRV